VRQFLQFIGISDIEFVYAEGLAIGPESRNKNLAAARVEARRLALATRLAA
jgi:FMN-dependent NADH-azoreductase